VAHDPFVEGGERVEFGGGEQVNQVPANIAHVLRGGLLDGSAPGGQQHDHGAAAVCGVGLADDQPFFLHVPDLVGKPALLPLQQGAHLLRGHPAPGVLREHREDLVVGRRQP
jgi:hypothetical protein